MPNSIVMLGFRIVWMYHVNFVVMITMLTFLANYSLNSMPFLLHCRLAHTNCRYFHSFFFCFGFVVSLENTKMISIGNEKRAAMNRHYDKNNKNKCKQYFCSWSSLCLCSNTKTNYSQWMSYTIVFTVYAFPKQFSGWTGWRQKQNRLHLKIQLKW